MLHYHQPTPKIAQQKAQKLTRDPNSLVLVCFFAPFTANFHTDFKEIHLFAVHIVRFFHRLRSPKRQVAVYLFSSSLFACFHIQRLFSSISSARKTNTAPSTKKTKSRQKIKKLFLWKCVNHLRANGEFDGKVFFSPFEPAICWMLKCTREWGDASVRCKWHYDCLVIIFYFNFIEST